MQKENRNNRVHTEQQSGKTEFLIASLLPVGKKNAIPTAELVKLSGCSSPLELQMYIAEERKRGAVICSSTTGGYFRPANRSEMAEFCKTLENRAENTLIAIRSTKKAMEAEKS